MDFPLWISFQILGSFLLKNVGFLSPAAPATSVRNFEVDITRKS